MPLTYMLTLNHSWADLQREGVHTTGMRCGSINHGWFTVLPEAQ